MRKLLNKPWVVALLALGAVAFVVHSLLPKKTVYGTAAAGVESPSGEEAVVDPDVQSAGARHDIRAALKEISITPDLRDPFTPRVQTPAASSSHAESPAEPDSVESVKLTALWVQDGTTFALLNGRVCQPGDNIGRLMYETATVDGVWLTHWKGRDFIALGASFTLTTPARKQVLAPAQPASTDS